MGNENAGKKIVAVVSVIAVIAMCAFIFYMSARPADESDAMSLGVVGHIIGLIVPGYGDMDAAEQLYWQQRLNYPVRKLAHFLEYAALGALMLNMLVRVACARGMQVFGKIAKLGATAWTISTLYAGTDEIHQLFVAGRAGKITDVLIDSSGVILGVLVVALIIWVVLRRKKPYEAHT